jgi:Short C-terminal domain
MARGRLLMLGGGMMAGRAMANSKAQQQQAAQEQMQQEAQAAAQAEVAKQLAAQPAAPVAAPTAPAAAEPDRIAQLKELAELHQSGVLNDAEFAAEKARILGGG